MGNCWRGCLLVVAGLFPAASSAEPAGLSPELVRELRFTIREIRIEGSMLVDAATLQSRLRPHHGSGRNLDALNAIRAAILDAYRENGFELLSVAYDAPRSRDGVHIFVVREVRIGKVTVTGAKQLSEHQVLRELPSLAEGSSPRLSQLARELFLFNDNPGRRAALEYRRGARGVTDVEVKLSESSQRRFAAIYNNAGNHATGVSRLGLYASDSNFLGRSNQVTGSLTTSDRPERVLVAGVSWLVPLPSMGDQLAFSASYSDVDSGRVAEVLSVSGKGATWGAHYLRNLGRTATSRHVLDIGYDERRYRDTIDFFGTNLGVSVTARPLSLGYRYSRLLSGHSFSLGATLQQNLAGGSRADDATYRASRAGARARWQSWQFDAAWQREYGSGWMPAIRFAGQYAREPLISAEQFGLGGLRAVRGFEEREGAGDRGWRANLELYGPAMGQGQRLLGFVDLGHSARYNAQPGERASEGVSSHGLGWRGQFGSRLQAGVDLARVANGTPRNPRGDWMLHASAAWWF